jgi:hypothetical protein
MTAPRRFGSRPEIPHSPDVYEILGEHDRRLEGLEGYAQENKLANATILSEVREIKATDRHATTKMISALVVTVITTIGGVIGTVAAMHPGAPLPSPARTVLDIKLDTCRPLAPGPSREECFARVIAETDH